MSASPFQYGFIFTADSTGFERARQQVVEGLQEMNQYSITFGETTEKAAEISARGFSRLIFGAQMSTWFMSMLVTATLRQESATIAVEQAQENYNAALARYGVNSAQAQRAARSLERAQNYVTRANMMQTASWVSLGLQGAQMITYMQQYGGVLSTIITQTWAYTSALVAQAIAWAAAHPYAAAAVLGAASAIAVGLGAYGLSQQVNVNVGNVTTSAGIEEAAEKTKRKIIDEYGRIAG